MNERFNGSPWRIWHSPTRKMYRILQWNHPSYLSYYLAVDNEEKEMKKLPQSECVLQAWTLFKDQMGKHIYEGDILLVTMKGGKVFSSLVIKEEGVVGMSHRGIFGPLPAMSAVFHGEVKNLMVIGNMYESPVYITETTEGKEGN